MVEYYSYWEQEIYNALTQLIITAMQVCQSSQSGRSSSSTAVVVSVLLYAGLYAAQNLMRLLAVKVPGQKGPVSKKPLFKIQAIVRCSQAARLLFSRISCGFPSLRVHVPVFISARPT